MLWIARRLRSVSTIVPTVTTVLVSLIVGFPPPDPPPVNEVYAEDMMAPETAAEFARLSEEEADNGELGSIKAMLVLALVEGRVSFPVVVTEFVRLNAYSDDMETILCGYPGTTEEERTARNVLECASNLVATERKSCVMSRLEAEFSRLYSATCASKERTSP